MSTHIYFLVLLVGGPTTFETSTRAFGLTPSLDCCCVHSQVLKHGWLETPQGWGWRWRAQETLGLPGVVVFLFRDRAGYLRNKVQYMSMSVCTTLDECCILFYLLMRRSCVFGWYWTYMYIRCTQSYCIFEYFIQYSQCVYIWCVLSYCCFLLMVFLYITVGYLYTLLLHSW